RFYFFHIIPPPPTSTLFPYTTLFRSVVSVVPDDLERRACRPPLLGGQYARRDGRTQWRPRGSRADDARGAHVAPGRDADAVFHRSEEHTSELQSRFDLVCRLLLEKKK